MNKWPMKLTENKNVGDKMSLMAQAIFDKYKDKKTKLAARQSPEPSNQALVTQSPLWAVMLGTWSPTTSTATSTGLSLRGISLMAP